MNVSGRLSRTSYWLTVMQCHLAVMYCHVVPCGMFIEWLTIMYCHVAPCVMFIEWLTVIYCHVAPCGMFIEWLTVIYCHAVPSGIFIEWLTSIINAFLWVHRVTHTCFVLTSHPRFNAQKFFCICKRLYLEDCLFLVIIMHTLMSQWVRISIQYSLEDEQYSCSKP